MLGDMACLSGGFYMLNFLPGTLFLSQKRDVKHP